MEHYLPPELLDNLLTRLPYKPLFKFKLVSKRWNSIISDLQFGRRHMLRSTSGDQSLLSSHLLGYLPTHVNGDDDDEPASSDPPSLYVSSLSSLPKSSYNVEILSSSRGLVLFRIHPTGDSDSRGEVRLCVSNPLTRHFARLPALPCPRSLWTVGLATSNDACMTYKVVYIRRKLPESSDEATNHTVIQTFSSETGEWSMRELEVVAPSKLFYCSETQMVSRKGILYFLDEDMLEIATYDPYNSPDRFEYIDLPYPFAFDFACPEIFRTSTCEDELPTYIFVDEKNRKVSKWRLVGHDNGGQWRHEAEDSVDRRWRRYCSLLVRVELCPWSSPLYYKSPKGYSRSLPITSCMKVPNV